MPGTSFYAQVRWMANNGISIGYVDGTCGQDRDVTRAEFATFLERFGLVAERLPPAGPSSRNLSARCAAFTRWMGGGDQDELHGPSDAQDVGVSCCRVPVTARASR